MNIFHRCSVIGVARILSWGSSTLADPDSPTGGNFPIPFLLLHIFSKKAYFLSSCSGPSEARDPKIILHFYAVHALEEGGGTLVQKNYACKMFFIQNNFSSFENIGGGPGPPRAPWA